MTKAPTFRYASDAFFALRDLRDDMLNERRNLDRSGMFTSEGVVDAFAKSAELNRWSETIDRAEAAINRHAEVAHDRLAKARAAAVAPPATVAEQTLAELRLARKIKMIDALIEKPGGNVSGLVAEADPAEVSAVVDYLRDLAESGHPRAESIRASIAHGVDQRDPAIAEAAQKVQHAEQMRSVAGMHVAGTRRVLESAGTRPDSIADAGIENGAADTWDVKLDAA